MHHINRSAIVPYSTSKMFSLVDDISSYPDFLPWCQGAEEIKRDLNQVVAELNIGIQTFNISFTTVNTLKPFESIRMELKNGPFKTLEGQWNFNEIDDQGCEVSLNMRFEFSSPSQDLILKKSFEGIFNQLLDAFINQANNRIK
ncbi:MAG: type II toxin-antitoxin system RatA family toxin [Pseudomonadota bacterium]|nr:type II toxin-antitoxin system RatA family toxin [Pseudomonadota bacterium]